MVLGVALGSYLSVKANYMISRYVDQILNIQTYDPLLFSIFIPFLSIFEDFLGKITQKEVVLGADGRLQGARKNFLRIANTYKLLL